MKKILVIDDDMDVCHLLKRFLTKNGFSVNTAHNGLSGLASLEEWNPDLILTDFRLGDMDGSEILPLLKAKAPYAPILVITGYSDLRIAVNVMKMGAFDYITKPLVPQEILLTIHKALDGKSGSNASEDNGEETLDKSVISVGSKISSGSYIMGSSRTAQNLYRQVDLVAKTNYSVIIYGESGSGKEAVAHIIHDRSPRRKNPFVAMDCGAIPKELANSELFGHEKGAFTGAIGLKIGHFEMANGGTLFLDEVANLAYDVQVALLRVVQERKIRRIGSGKEIPLDVRIIVASNENLMEATQKGKFREDLYHRFNEFSLHIPPLRERKDDIMLFAERFLEETSVDLGKTMTGFDPEVGDIFLEYPWPGNVRELKNVVKRAALLSDGDKIQLKALPFEIVNYYKLFQDHAEHEPVVASTAPAIVSYTPVSSSPTAPSANLKIVAQDAEYEAVRQALEQVHFNKSKAAKALGIDRKTLYNKLKKYRLG